MRLFTRGTIVSVLLALISASQCWAYPPTLSMGISSQYGWAVNQSGVQTTWILYASGLMTAGAGQDNEMYRLSVATNKWTSLGNLFTFTGTSVPPYFALTASTDSTELNGYIPAIIDTYQFQVQTFGTALYWTNGNHPMTSMPYMTITVGT